MWIECRRERDSGIPSEFRCRGWVYIYIYVLFFPPMETIIIHLLGGEWFRMFAYYLITTRPRPPDFQHDRWGHHHTSLEMYYAPNSFHRKTGLWLRSLSFSILDQEFLGPPSHIPQEQSFRSPQALQDVPFEYPTRRLGQKSVNVKVHIFPVQCLSRWKRFL